MTNKKTVANLDLPPASVSQPADSDNQSHTVQPVSRITAIRPRRDKPGPTVPLKNGTYERFALQIAGGRSAVEAYRACGYRGKGKSQSACRLLRRPEVAARVESLRMDVSRQVVSEIAVDAGWVQDNLTTVMHRAMEAGNFGAAIRALYLLGKNIGMYQTTPEEMAQKTNLADTLVDARRRVLEHDKQQKVIRKQEMEQELMRQRTQEKEQEKEQEIQRRVEERLALLR